MSGDRADPGPFRHARDRGCAYLLARLHTDGSFGDPANGLADYYKVPMALQACGETHAANRLCAWIRAHGFTPVGDFGPRPESAKGYAYAYAYYNAWVILGAQRLAQLDLAQRGMDFLMRLHDSESGGFYSSATDRGPDVLQDIWVVSGAGQAALATGRIDVARAVGRWFRAVMEQQPEFPRRLYGVFSRARGLITEPDPADPTRFVLEQDATGDQQFFNPGIAAGFLCRLYQASGESEWLALAREYLRFVEGASDFLWGLLRAGKVGWAGALLYTLTGEATYANVARRVGAMLVETQAGDGSWNLFGAAHNDMTAEMVVWLDEIYQALGDGG